MINQNQSCELKKIFIVVISMIFFAKFNHNWILFKKIHEVWLKFKNSENQLISMNSVSEKSLNELLEIWQVSYRLINTQNCGLYETENCLSKSDNKVPILPIYNFGSWSVFSGAEHPVPDNIFFVFKMPDGRAPRGRPSRESIP